MHAAITRTGLALAYIAAGAVLLFTPAPTRAEFDKTRYMSPDELRPGMRGYGRTVMSGSKIETFQIEVVSVMRNAYYAKQDVILVRCSGLNLEHSGIIGGMSGSPCYIRDDQGRDRMIGAVAYGWTFNKDPLCGVQPITQMLPIPDVRTPKEPLPGGEKKPPVAAGQEKRSSGGGIDLGRLLARVITEPIDPACRFSIFNNEIRKAHPLEAPEAPPVEGLRPLLMPVMVSGVSDRGLSRLARHFDRLGLTPVASGGPSAAAMANADAVKLEPGSTLCIPFVTGDMMMEGLGTCTQVDGNRVLGFGHAMFGEGSVELPLATGMVHTVIPSVMRSNKIGAALRNVGTLLGDESSGIFGLLGNSPEMIPVEVVVKDLRGERTYNYKIVQERFYSAMLLAMTIMESGYAHSDLPKEHTVRYSLETEFKDLGTFKTSNFSSQNGLGGMAMEAAVPVQALLDTPFGKARLQRARAVFTVEEGARLANLDEARPDRNIYKPGETVRLNVRWQHYLGAPLYTRENYQLKIPEDLPDGEYDLTIGSYSAHLLATRREKPHLFDVDALGDMLKAFNLLASFPQNRLYLHLTLPTSGLAVEDTEMPELPSYRRQILLAAHDNKVHRFTDSMVTTHETPFAVAGQETLKIKVSRRADQ